MWLILWQRTTEAATDEARKCYLGDAHSLNGLCDGAHLVDLQQQSIAGLLLNGLLHCLGVGTQQIISHHLSLTQNTVRQRPRLCYAYKISSRMLQVLVHILVLTWGLYTACQLQSPDHTQTAVRQSLQGRYASKMRNITLQAFPLI